MNILIADDEEINRILIQEFLANLGFHCQIAENGAMAVNLAKLNSIDLIFMDLRMPEMNGIEATEKILSDDSISRKPIIIALTANSANEEKAECIKAGMNDFLQKPFRIKDLKLMLEKWNITK